MPDHGQIRSVTDGIARAAKILLASPQYSNRKLGRTLRSVELLGQEILESGEVRRKGRHPKVYLGYHTEDQKRILEKGMRALEGALLSALGGTGVTVSLEELQPEQGWQFREKELNQLTLRNVRPVRKFEAEWRNLTPRQRDNCMLDDGMFWILARHTRWNICAATGQYDQTFPIRMQWWLSGYAEKHWVERKYSSNGTKNRVDDRAFEVCLFHISELLCGHNLNQESTDGDPHDFGQIDLLEDPLRVVALGPWSNGKFGRFRAPTWEDVGGIFDLAGSRVQIKEELGRKEQYGDSALSPYLEALQDIADEIENAREHPEESRDQPDVVIIFRGGFDSRAKQPSDDEVRRFKRLCLKIRNCGTEVVVAIGHGNYCVWTRQSAAPAGVYEAITPTAGALWILQHHIGLSI